MARRAVQRVAIIGAGPGGTISGSALALLCLRSGFDTVLEDVLPGNLRRAAAELESAGPVLAPRFAGSIEDAVRDADLVIDTVPDELESKLEILSLLDRMAPPGTLFATPTETLSIADLASCTYRAAQCFGLRFSTVVAQLYIDLSYPPVCDAATIETMTGFLQALGATVQASPDERALP